MQKILWILFLFIVPFQIQAGALEDSESSEEDTLAKEVASVQSSKKEFGELVKSTMELMGPGMELTQNVDSTSTTAQE
jgi:hypothetical protein